MARHIKYLSQYPYEPKLIYQSLTNRQFWEDGMSEFLKYTSYSEIQSFTTSETGTEVVLRHLIPKSELPPIAQTIMKVDMYITRVEQFGLFDEELSTGSFSLSVPAGPGYAKGTRELFPTSTGSSIRQSAETKVYVPFVGAKIEQLILVNLAELVKGEQEFLTEWVKKNY